MTQPPPDAKVEDDPILTACVDMIGRTGATSIQIRYSDDESPVIWMAVATYEAEGGGQVHETSAGMTPAVAAYRLCEQLVDGGICAHCTRPAGISDDFTGDMPLEKAICWFVYDPERKTFRRSCEVETRPDTCPHCRHQAHGPVCFNMASDNDCSCTIDTVSGKT